MSPFEAETGRPYIPKNNSRVAAAMRRREPRSLAEIDEHIREAFKEYVARVMKHKSKNKKNWIYKIGEPVLVEEVRNKRMKSYYPYEATLEEISKKGKDVKVRWRMQGPLKANVPDSVSDWIPIVQIKPWITDKEFPQIFIEAMGDGIFTDALEMVRKYFLIDQ